MIDQAKSMLMMAGDALLGWLLWLPRDVSLVVLAVLVTALLLTIRRWVTNQPLLRCVQADRRQLRGRLRDARRRSDQAARQRYRRTRSALAWLRLRCELPALLVSLAVLVLLLVWADERFGYLPPASAEPVPFSLALPAERIGEVIHLVPRDGLQATPSWVRQVEREAESGSLRGTARWTLTWSGEPAELLLTVRLNDQVVQHPAVFGQRHYAVPRRQHGPRTVSTLELRPYVPFQLTPLAFLPPGAAWQPVFFLLVLTLFYAGRHTLGIA